MKRFKPHVLLVFLSIVSTVSFYCESRSAGVISGVDNKTAVIEGHLITPCGDPASNALVVMRPRDYLPESSYGVLGKRKTGFSHLIYSTYTDHHGTYRFTKGDSIQAGVYCIEGTDDISGNCIFIDNIVIDSVLLNSDTWIRIPGPQIKTDSTLRQPGTVTGFIHTVDSPTTGSVYIYGLESYTPINQDGSFTMSAIPPGNHRVHIELVYRGNEWCFTHQVMVSVGATDPIEMRFGVFYNGNGNTGGEVPSSDSIFTIGDTMTILGNSGDLRKTGSTFTGWNTHADGSGDWCHPGDILVIDTAAIVLYAQWKSNRYVVTVKSNGNGTVHGSDSVAHGIAHAITATADTGYLFESWKVVNGNATIDDSTAPSTTVILEDGNATVAGTFIRSITFQKTFATIANRHGGAGYSVQQTDDGGYILTGTVDGDYFLIKATVYGDTVWTKTFGGPYNDYGYYLQQTSDGGYIITGETEYYNQTQDEMSVGAFLTKSNAEGTVEWIKTFNEIEIMNGKSCVETSDEGYVVTGYKDNGSKLDISLIKTTANGDILWTNTFEEPDHDVVGYSVQETTDGGYLIFGGTKSIEADWWNVFLIKTTMTGTVAWTKTFENIFIDYGASMEQTTDGGYIIVGNTKSMQEGFEDILVTKTSSEGDILWKKTFGGTGTDIALMLKQTSDEGYIIAGKTYSFGGCSNVYLIKTSSTGDSLWTKTFGGIFDDCVYSVQQTDDGGYILTGEFGMDGGGSEVYLIKTDKSGNIY